jgi:hypothetical protein
MKRRKSAIDRAKQIERIERLRRMKPEDRLQACLSISALTGEFQRAGKRFLEQNPRS